MMPRQPTGRWAVLAVLLLASACALAPAARGPSHAPLLGVDPPRRPGKPLALIVMPDSESFRTVRRALVNEVKNELDVTTHIIDAHSSSSNFNAELEHSGAACVVLMDNPTVRLYRAYQNSRHGQPLIPAVVVMASFLEELSADLVNASGVAYEVPGVTAFVHLRAVVDRPVRRVGVVHRPAFSAFLERQKLLAAKEQITLVPVRVPADPSAAEVRDALAGLAARGDIDALWVLNDNGLLRDSDFVEAAWRKQIAALGVPVVVGVPTLVSPEIRFGTFAVLPDLDALGVQAGNVVLDLAENEWKANRHPVELPVSTLTVVNMRQVRQQFGLRPDAERHVDRALE